MIFYCRVGPEMPFWKKGREGKDGEKINYKARLEHKQWLVSSFLCCSFLL